MSENTGTPLGSEPKEGLPGLTPTELETLRKVFSSPLDIPQEWKAWLVSYLEANPPVLPISQIFGFSSFTVQVAPIVTDTDIDESSASYISLSSAGPEFSDLPKGSYLLLFGCQLSNSSGACSTYMSISVNGGAPSDSQSVLATGTDWISGVTVVPVVLDQDVNTVVAKYRSSCGNIKVQNRWLIALKYAN